MNTRPPALQSTSGLSGQDHEASNGPQAKDTPHPNEPKSHHTPLQTDNGTTTHAGASTADSPMTGASTKGLGSSSKYSAPDSKNSGTALTATPSHIHDDAESMEQSATRSGKRIVRPTKKVRGGEKAVRTPKQRVRSPTQSKQSKPQSGKRKPFQYTEAWAKRHRRCLREDDQGRGIWLHPVQDVEMSVRCNHCDRMDFKTVHSFLCHMVKIHGEPRKFVTGLEAVLDRYGVEVNLEDSGLDPVSRRERQSSQEQHLGNTEQRANEVQQGRDERRVRILTESPFGDEKPRRKTIGTIEDDFSSSSISSLPSDDEEEEEVGQEDSIKVASSATITQGSNGTVSNSTVPQSTFTWSPNPISNPRPPLSKPAQSALQKAAAATAPPSTIPPTPSSQNSSSNPATQAALSKAREINARLSDADSDFSPSLDGSANPVPSNPAERANTSHPVVLKYKLPNSNAQASATDTASQDLSPAAPKGTNTTPSNAASSKVTGRSKLAEANFLPPPSGTKRKSFNNATDTSTPATKATASTNAKRRKADLPGAYEGATEELGVRKNGGRIVRRVKPLPVANGTHHPADELQNLGDEGVNGHGNANGNERGMEDGVNGNGIAIGNGKGVFTTIGSLLN